jgi:hypothetical protein
LYDHPLNRLQIEVAKRDPAERTIVVGRHLDVARWQFASRHTSRLAGEI